MYLSRIFIKNFRNLREIDLPISSGLTCFIGENNCGKTNLIHALRLALDGSLSATRRRMTPADLSNGLSFASPTQVLISIEFADFRGVANQEAMHLESIVGTNKARLTYRFRPSGAVRKALQEDSLGPLPLKVDDYRWELVGGGDDDLDLKGVTWDQNFGTTFSTDQLQQGYLVVLMEALRDVEARLGQARSSPLQRLLEQVDIPEGEKQALVEHLRLANASINESTTLETIGTGLSSVFRDSVGQAFAMEVSLGLSEPSFGDISRALRVLLSGYGLQNVDTSRNGLGLNNILYMIMYLKYFERRIEEGKTAGQLLLIEEPEAHLHPQLQRVLLKALQRRAVQVFVTTHSTHIASATALRSNVVMTGDAGASTAAVAPSNISNLTAEHHADLERYLDATRSTLLFAQGVLLVEGPAEQFLIPPLVKAVLDIDLDEHAISIIPIYGTHFAAYARLFGPTGVRKKCAIVADGDLVPSDVAIVTDDDDLSSIELVAVPQELESLQNEYVRVFRSTTTLEREITLSGNLAMLADTARVLGAPKVWERLDGASRTESPDLPELGALVLRTAKRIGKARFAQVASRLVRPSSELPSYIRAAVEWLTTNEADR